MARPLRIEYAGAVYHVMNRGNGRQRIFHGRRYYELFLEKMELFADKFGVEVRCYSLMPNHFHLYVRTEQPNLGRFMQSFLPGQSLGQDAARHDRRSSCRGGRGPHRAGWMEPGPSALFR